MQKLNKLTRGIILLSLLAFVGVVGCSDSETVETGPMLVTLEMVEGTPSPMVNLVAGMENYDLRCQGCHGAMGQGTPGSPALDNYALGSPYATFASLQTKIHSTMPRAGGNPPQMPSDCEDTCADDVSGYIYCEWNPTLVTSGCPAP